MYFNYYEKFLSTFPHVVWDKPLPFFPTSCLLWQFINCLVKRRTAFAAKPPVVFRYMNIIGTPIKRYPIVNSRDIDDNSQSIPLPAMKNTKIMNQQMRKNPTFSDYIWIISIDNESLSIANFKSDFNTLTENCDFLSKTFYSFYSSVKCNYA